MKLITVLKLCYVFIATTVRRKFNSVHLSVSIPYGSLSNRSNINYFIFFSNHKAVTRIEMMSSEDIQKTVENNDHTFTKLLIELLDKLSMYSTRDCEQQMMNMVSRLDHNGFYSEHQRKLLPAKGKKVLRKTK